MKLAEEGPLSGPTAETAAEYVRFANAAAALCIGKRGAIPAMPGSEEVRAFMDAHGAEG